GIPTRGGLSTGRNVRVDGQGCVRCESNRDTRRVTARRIGNESHVAANRYTNGRHKRPRYVRRLHWKSNEKVDASRGSQSETSFTDNGKHARREPRYVHCRGDAVDSICRDDGGAADQLSGAVAAIPRAERSVSRFISGGEQLRTAHAGAHIPCRHALRE